MTRPAMKLSRYAVRAKVAATGRPFIRYQPPNEPGTGTHSGGWQCVESAGHRAFIEAGGYKTWQACFDDLIRVPSRNTREYWRLCNGIGHRMRERMGW